MPTIDELRGGVADLHIIAAADLRNLWSQVSTAVEAREALEDVLPLLVETYGSAAAAVAADWYDEQRDELGVPRRFSAIAADASDRGSDVLARWGVGPLFSTDPNWARAKTLIDGGLQRRIADAARETIQLSSVEDPSARGWQRAAARGCAFCSMLAGRGAVYTATSANFAAHDHCHCIALPAFEGHPNPVKAFKPSEQVASDADRARVRAWLADNVSD